MTVLVLLAALSFPQGECAAWARLVESVEAIPVEQHQWARWKHEGTPLTVRYLNMAQNWLAQGNTGAQAWRECESV